MQQRQTIIEIRPCTGGWQFYEGPGVQPYWTGDTAKEDTLDYAIAPQNSKAANLAGSFSAY